MTNKAKLIVAKLKKLVPQTADNAILYGFLFDEIDLYCRLAEEIETHGAVVSNPMYRQPGKAILRANPAVDMKLKTLKQLLKIWHQIKGPDATANGLDDELIALARGDDE